MSNQEQPRREVAYRTFSREFNDATYSFKESDDEYAPLYVLLPTGAAANRVFVVGSLTETENIGDETNYWRGRIADPVGSFFCYASQYQSEAMEKLREIDPPEYVSVTGKPRTYETDDGDINVSIQPEVLAVVDANTRERWIVETAERTIQRIKSFEESSNPYAKMVVEEYGEPLDMYKKTAIEALESLDEDMSAG